VSGVADFFSRKTEVLRDQARMSVRAGFLHRSSTHFTRLCRFDWKLMHNGCALRRRCGGFCGHVLILCANPCFTGFLSIWTKNDQCCL